MMVAEFGTTREPRGTSAEAQQKPRGMAHGLGKARAHGVCANVFASGAQGAGSGFDLMGFRNDL